jgi:hypothetical protein
MRTIDAVPGDLVLLRCDLSIFLPFPFPFVLSALLAIMTTMMATMMMTMATMQKIDGHFYRQQRKAIVWKPLPPWRSLPLSRERNNDGFVGITAMM